MYEVCGTVGGSEVSGFMVIGKVQMQQIAPQFEIGQLSALNGQHFTMSTMDEQALQLEVIALFLNQITAIQTSSAKADSAFLAHTLRGAALAVGADEIAEIAGLWQDKSISRPAFEQFLQLAETRFKAAIDSFFQHS